MFTPEDLNRWSLNTLPGLLGIDILSVEAGRVTGRLLIRAELLAPHGYLHAATVVGLAATACGYGAMANLPDGAQSFAMIELKTNFVGTAQKGTIECEAYLVHGGRTTQVWDAQVTDTQSRKVIALFRCTQMILYPRS
jgi:1,4-dihydroxy-2-naphthoyl-CoA hydrolase